MRVFCEDGRDFMRAMFKRAYEEPFPPYSGPKESKRQADRKRRRGQNSEIVSVEHEKEIQPVRNRIAHVVMNLPETAIEFLDTFRRLLTHSGRELSGFYDTMPMVHCHCFTRFLELGEAEADIRKVRYQTRSFAVVDDNCDFSVFTES